MKTTKFHVHLALTVIALLLTACGGGSGSSSSSSSATSFTGQFLDSPVQNIGYRTATQEGFTNEQGESSSTGPVKK
ncbi:hypothetical protein [Endozoicomonas lisbonensis]|uniref:hypothetical protein n=1 Tax=Endozoicomonas lisbonensis TaxID=3120522 RepID=UPI003393DD1E